MLLRPALSVMTIFSCIAIGFATEPTNKTVNKLEIRLAETEPANELIAAKVVGTENLIYLHKKVVATNKDVAEAKLVTDARGEPAIGITFTAEGAKKIAKMSENNIGKRAAILVEGKVISAPVIRGRISTKAEISGNFSAQEAARIAKALNTK